MFSYNTFEWKENIEWTPDVCVLTKVSLLEKDTSMVTIAPYFRTINPEPRLLELRKSLLKSRTRLSSWWQ